MKCSDVLEQLDDFVDRELEDAQASVIAEHIGGCPACAGRLEALENMLALASELPREIAPEHDLWPRIEGSISRKKVVAFPVHRRHFWQLAAAAAVVVAAIVGGYLIGLHQQAPHIVEVGSTENAVLAANDSWSLVPPSLQQTRAQLRAALDARKDSLSPQTIAMVEENLEIIDRAISEISLALNETPNNPRLQRQLYFACSQEISLLQRAASFPAEI